jgi:hypothetical protein
LEKGEIKMTIQNLVNEIFEKSFSRESLERLLTKEIKKKVERGLTLVLSDEYKDESLDTVISETLKSE